MSKLLDELTEKLNSMSKEELEKEWQELSQYDYGPTVEEYFENLKKYGLYSK
jgi:hypothetical protein